LNRLVGTGEKLKFLLPSLPSLVVPLLPSFFPVDQSRTDEAEEKEEKRC
jgi:hypothetical protein